ncbi:AAA family ATPase [Sinirhodobacter sp. WL0062]|uniref:AAA family ATPase n=1 Tax=Rhodobacter flavimaris TaxID=2907145 RepID=A0ABS8YQR6_9RHOB|nr:AAA family ATPase [Sinirhodobacter sp. WL0062]MCE5972028.1 AAA family ATPase [Sinirhodobacter sp. WL0062]
MAVVKKSIVLVSKDASLSATIAKVLGELPGVAVEECAATLSDMNGKAQELALASDLIIFRTQENTDNDIAALQGIQRAGGTARLLALSGDDVTLSSIRRLIGAGVSEVLPDTVSAAELDEQVRRLTIGRGLALAGPSVRHGKVISVSKARGGIGATTLAVNLADQLRGQKRLFRRHDPHDVVVVDLDLQFGNVGGFLDVAPSQALIQLAKEEIDPDETFIEQALQVTPSGIAVLASPEGFAPLNALRANQIHVLIERLRTRFDYVIVDLPRAMVEWISPVLDASDRMYLVSDTSVPCIQQARRLIDFYREENLSLPIEVVISQEKKPLVMSRHHVEAAKALERKFRHWLPSDRRTAAEAVDRGKPLSAISARSGLTKAIGRIAFDLIAEAGSGQSATKADS